MQDKIFTFFSYILIFLDIFFEAHYAWLMAKKERSEQSEAVYFVIEFTPLLV